MKMTEEDCAYPGEDSETWGENIPVKDEPALGVDSSVYMAVLDYNGSRMFIKRSSMSAQVS